MAPAKQPKPVSREVIQKEFEKGRATLRKTKKKTKLKGDREVIDLQIKTLENCTELLKNILLI
jgi:hypothetical protein